jgi:hypothetical protein
MLYSDPFETLMQLQQALDTFRGSSWLGTSGQNLTFDTRT